MVKAGQKFKSFGQRVIDAGRKIGGGEKVMVNGVTRVEAETAPDNVASQKLLVNASFVPTGQTGEEGPRFTLTRGEAAAE